ncbi:hypothetical protein BACI71_100397 [Bacillus mycoides]|uniref:Uncharacterized protein n=1 Tax=Bacillus mycoides TaxID=1405 RepID=A0A653NPN0_BACMY|nr:hypothetical protein BACI71_100397 [Bacillus mycoides]
MIHSIDYPLLSLTSVIALFHLIYSIIGILRETTLIPLYKVKL